VRHRLVMRVVPNVLDGLRLSQSSDGQDTEHKDDREKSQDAVVHQKATCGECAGRY
jgi:hypothetical protein